MDQAINLCNEIGADYLTVSGDVFDSGVPHAEVVKQVTERLNKLDRTKVVFVNGNHDQQRVVGKHRTPVDAYLAEHKNVLHVAGSSEVFYHDGVAFALSPWQRVAGQKVEETSEELTDIINRLGDEVARHEGPSIFLAHIVVDECTFDSGRRSSEVLMGTRQFEASVPTSLLDSGPWGSAQLGHIHKRQQLSDKVWYTGSTFKVSFGERNEDKGASILRYNSDGSADVDFHKFDVRELHQIDLRGPENLTAALHELAQVKSGDLVRLVVDEEAERSAEFAKIVKRLGKEGVNPDLSRDLSKHNHAGERRKGLALDTDPLTVLKEYGAQQKTDPKLLKRATDLFQELIAH